MEYNKSLDRPIFSVSLHNASGKRLEAPQDTPPGHFDRRSHTIAAGHEVQFRTPMDQMPPGESTQRGSPLPEGIFVKLTGATLRRGGELKSILDRFSQGFRALKTP